MFRQGIRRCAGLEGSARLMSMLRTRAALTNAAPHSLGSALIGLKALSSYSRSYSSEAVARDSQQGDDSASSESTEFADLSKLSVNNNLIDAITKGMGYKKMTPVQAKTIAPALKGTDIVAQAKTGTGKTLAFLLPLLQRMIQEDPSLASRSASYQARSDDIRGIVLSPTRELAEQIAREAREVTRRTGLVVQSAVGGTQKFNMLRQVQAEGCHLLVATPGRLNDLLSDPRSGIEAPKLAALVLDEADRMLDVGFERELDEIISRLPRASEKLRQTLLVSATIPDNVIRLARTMIRPDDFTFVQTISENESLTHDRVPQNIVPIRSWANIFPAIWELIDREMAKCRSDPAATTFKAIVYFNTTALVQLVGEMSSQARKDGKMPCSAFVIHSKLSQMQRTRAAELFREAKSAVLFSSDVTARGMDFPNVTHVVQVDVPRDRESYIHRLGRTARQDKDGEGWLLMPPLSMGLARRMMQSLPLEKNETLKSAAFDPESGDVSQSPYHEQVQNMIRVARREFRAAYLSLFGGQPNARDELVDDLNRWAVKFGGMYEPPPVSPEWARKQGLIHANVNVKEGADRDYGSLDDRGRYGRSGSGRFGFGRGNGGGGRDFGRRDDRRPSDPFAAMGRQARQDGSERGRGGRGSRW